MTTCRLLVLFFSLIALSATAQIPDDVSLDSAFGGQFFSFPIAVRHAGDGSGRKFVVEKAGRIRIVDEDNVLLGSNFLDISAITESSANERGLLGMAFHPDFSSNGLVYVKHSAQNLAGVTTGDTVVAEYSVSTGNPNQLEPASRRQILVVPQDFNNHNGGDLHFGPDGYLYIGMGDGGSGNDPCDRGQVLDPSTSPGGSCRSGQAAWLLGKMIRIDIDNTTPAGSNNLCAASGNGSAEYAIPSDNPYVGMSNRCGEVWSYGLRNPYRFSFDRDTGDMWIGDVGQNRWEEINLEPAGTGGRNYGWRICEGNWLRGSTTQPCTLAGHTGPVIEYSIFQQTECAVTGGFRYRGPVLSMHGLYVYGDYCSGRIWFASETSPGQWTPTEFSVFGGFGNLVGFGEDEEGNLYAVRGSGQILIFNGDTEVFYEVGGTVSGLVGSGLVLQNNGEDDLAISGDGIFQFDTPIGDGESYEVTVFSQPETPVQACSVSNGSGTIAGADVTDVSVSCVTASFTIGGEVTGLEGSGLVLQNNQGDDLAVTENGSFTFATPIEDLGGYNVVVSAQPENPLQTCTVSNGEGQVAGADVENITITCVSETFTIGGTVSGLEGSGLVLQNNGEDDLTISTDGPFEFPTGLAQGQPYLVTIASQPTSPMQECQVDNGDGTVATSDIDNIQITCISLDDEIFDDRFETLTR